LVEGLTTHHKRILLQNVTLGIRIGALMNTMMNPRDPKEKVVELLD
jgi:hypothetical protein